MASITKFLKSPKKYTAKKFSSGIKTVKDQPLTLAATVLSTLSELAQDNENYNKGVIGARAPLSSLLKTGAQLTQGWQNAKNTTKKNEKSRLISAIVNAPDARNEDGSENPNGMKTMDKVNRLIAAGETKIAHSLLNAYGVKKSLKQKKRQFGETVRMNNSTIENQDRNFDETKKNNEFGRQYKTAQFSKSVADTDWEHKHTTTRDSVHDSQWQQGQGAKDHRVLVNAIGNILKKGGTPEQLLTLIKNNSFASGLQVKKGIPFITGQKITLNEPKFIDNPNKGNALKRFINSIKDI
jgi:hypothetical protein